MKCLPHTHTRGPSPPKGLTPQGLPRISQRTLAHISVCTQPTPVSLELSLKLLSSRVDVYLLSMVTSWSQRSTQPCDPEFPQWAGMGEGGGGILRLFSLLLGTQCPKPDAWQGKARDSGDGCRVAQQTKGTRKFLLPPSHLGTRTSHGGRVAGLWNNGSL